LTEDLSFMVGGDPEVPVEVGVLVAVTGLPVGVAVGVEVC
jgi:hypothetical protein